MSSLEESCVKPTSKVGRFRDYRKGYHKRKTYESNQVEYIKGETPLVEVPRSCILVTDI